MSEENEELPYLQDFHKLVSVLIKDATQFSSKGFEALWDNNKDTDVMGFLSTLIRIKVLEMTLCHTFVEQIREMKIPQLHEIGSLRELLTQHIIAMFLLNKAITKEDASTIFTEYNLDAISEYIANSTPEIIPDNIDSCVADLKEALSKVAASKI
jgi:hypothetical protein